MMRGLCFFLLPILTQVSPESLDDVIGLTGHNVTLPCRYDSRTHGVLSFCWGRGKVPRFKCADTVLSSEDGAIQSRRSSRYQLQGSLTDGDVSLTILDARWSDGGVYGCRVQIPGWFNDYKVNTLLVMVEASVEQPVTQDWTPGTTVRHDEQSEMETTSAPVNVGDATAAVVGHTREKFKASLEVGNVARMGAIFFSTIIIILAFIFRRSFHPVAKLQRLNTSAAENIYESI
ncbi:T-cell immunoglobulin and mucin domain-containing protein 4-like [Solea senegalensis]|uniref:T-cell immunoglobulin and mucin domain-containing protein 4-like isoform X1 n=1 Tax=Solea senegalensis TaxID=28829 RepID=UPI001C4119DB|nr:T-cell immunoglobulin and mucin domain-containing protein 4-like isoform X1 [Solea senegalensis]KAG7518870.1 T-cell immunoglobulin and mucin domain-containing protein 4-like [Solea senegalensis]